MLQIAWKVPIIASLSNSLLKEEDVSDTEIHSPHVPHGNWKRFVPSYNYEIKIVSAVQPAVSL